MNASGRRGRRGSSLAVMMVTLSLLGAFAVVFTRTFSLTMRSAATAGEAHTRSRRLDLAIESIARDVWMAAAVRVDADGTLVLDDGAGGPPVHWRAANASVTRTRGGVEGRDAPAADVERWHGLGLSLAFTHHPAGVEVVALDERGREAGRWVLAAPHARHAPEGGRP